MLASYSNHAIVRTQQRGIPPLINNWLLQYGDEAFDGRGGIVRYFSPNCIRRMRGEVGAAAVKRLSEFMRCYLVESSGDGAIITVGKRYPNKHIWRH